MEATRSEAGQGETLNGDQSDAAGYGIDERRISGLRGYGGTGPLLIIAGAGSGKTTTLAHRVARLVLAGADPQRILLLTFTRRAAVDMTRRCERIVARALSDARGGTSSDSPPGTKGPPAPAMPFPLRPGSRGPARFTASPIACCGCTRRASASTLPLRCSTDRIRRTCWTSFAARTSSTKKASRFPRKGTCLAIYSHVLNTQRSVEEALAQAFPWCREWEAELRVLFRAYVEAKQARNVLDYDDLLSGGTSSCRIRRWRPRSENASTTSSSMNTKTRTLYRLRSLQR